MISRLFIWAEKTILPRLPAVLTARTIGPRVKAVVAVVSYFAVLLGLGQAIITWSPDSLVTILFGTVILSVGFLATFWMTDLQPVTDGVMEASGIKTIRVFVTAVVTSIVIGVTFLVLGAQLPKELSDGLWQYSEAVAGLSAAVAGTAIAGIGFVFGSTEGRISAATTGFVNSHRKTIALVRSLDQEMESLWRSFDDLASDLGETFFSKLRLSAQVVDAKVYEQLSRDANDRVLDILTDDASCLTRASSAARETESTPTPFETIDWTAKEGRELGEIRRGLMGFSPSSKQETWGLFPVDTEFLVSTVFAINSNAAVPDYFQRTSIDATREIAQEFVRRNEATLERAREIASKLVDHTADLPIRTELLFDDLTLMNLLLRPFEDEHESGSRLDLAAVRFLGYCATYVAGRSAGLLRLKAEGAESDLSVSRTKSLGYRNYLEAILASDLADSLVFGETLGINHPLHDLSAFVGVVRAYLGNLNPDELLNYVGKITDPQTSDGAREHHEKILLGLIADVTYGRSHLRNWLRTVRAAEVRTKLFSNPINSDPSQLLSSAKDSDTRPHRRSSELGILRVDQRMPIDWTWSEIATEHNLSQAVRPDSLRVSSLSDLSAVRDGTKSSRLVQRLQLSGVLQ